jgi:hypothetical protein
MLFQQSTPCWPKYGYFKISISFESFYSCTFLAVINRKEIILSTKEYFDIQKN